MFSIEGYETLGKIVTVKVGHNGKGNGSEWDLEKIEIKRESTDADSNVQTFYFTKTIRKGKQYKG